MSRIQITSFDIALSAVGSAQLSGGAVSPVNLSVGGPSWSTSGDLSATGIIYSGKGNSNSWDTAYSLVSGGIVSTISLPQSAGWQSTFNTVSSLSANWNSAYTNLTGNSGIWNNVWSTVNSNSATQWNYQGNDLKSLSAEWQTTSYSVSSLSANWNSAYTTLTGNSSSWVTYSNLNTGSFVKYTDINTASGNWNTAYTNLNNLSSTYSAVTSVNGTANQINAVTNNSVVTVSLPLNITTPGHLNISGNAYLSGSLYLAGSAYQTNLNELVVDEPIIYLANTNPGNTYDIGVVGHFVNAPIGYQHTGLVRSAVSGVWTLFSGLTTEPASGNTINYTDPTFTIETLRSNIYGNLSGDYVSTPGGDSNKWNTTYKTVCALSAGWSGGGSGGATGGGNDKIFFLYSNTVTTSYSITNGLNANSFGPVTIANGVSVTLPSGQAWTIL